MTGSKRVLDLVFGEGIVPGGEEGGVVPDFFVGRICAGHDLDFGLIGVAGIT